MFPIFMTLVFAVLLYFALEKKTEGLQIIAGVFGLFTFLAWVFMPVIQSTVKDEIQTYYEKKIVIQNLNLKNMSDLRKAQALESFIQMDRKMRYYKKNYNGFWFGIYIPNEDCKNIELIKGW